MGVNIKYNNYAVGARESFVPTAENVENFVNLQQLQKYNVVVPNYTNPCEAYQTTLDGTATPFPDNPENANTGILSSIISDEDGHFSQGIELSLRSAELFSSQGITLEFDKVNNIYCTDLSVVWYRDNEILSEKSYEPNSAVFVCENLVEYYNRVDITFNRINMPHNRLKLVSIDYGYALELTGANLKNASLTQVIDPISAEFPISTGNFALWIDTDLNLFFRNKEPLMVYFNGKLRAKLFIKDAKRTQKKQWSIQAEDYIGLLDGVNFYGGIYENKDATELIGEIMSIARIPFEIDHTLYGVKVSGHIPYGSCRKALMQVAFAIMAVVNTSNSDIVRIYPLSQGVSQTIPLSRIMQGQNFVEKDVVTSVQLTAHSYRKTYERQGKYEADKSGIGDGIFVKLSAPAHSFEITNGEILESGANYAIINAQQGCVLTYWNYEHATLVKTKNNPLVVAGTLENVVSIDNATLISQNNIDKVLNFCYNYIVTNKEINSRIVENSFKGHKPVNVGDKIAAETQYQGNMTGIVIKQTYGLNGGILVKDTVIK
jgi:hypothetical protein